MEKALKIDDSVAEAHSSLGAIKLFYDWDWQGAEQQFKRASELNPSYAHAHQWNGLNLCAQGRLEEAIAEMKRAQELDPLSLIISTNVGWAYYFARRYDQAIEQHRKTIEWTRTSPGFISAWDSRTSKKQCTARPPLNTKSP